MSKLYAKAHNHSLYGYPYKSPFVVYQTNEEDTERIWQASFNDLKVAEEFAENLSRSLNDGAMVRIVASYNSKREVCRNFRGWQFC